MNYVEQFENYVKEQQSKGLKSLHICWNNPDNLDQPPQGTTYESFCEEFMRMVNAPTLSDEEVLGRYGKL